ncbi:MAG TPA: VOC family protein [Ilumatobacteraceae bacterium]|jgi:catechol 2,3-dioxygenase-like lactoylglutathione lyase family enzyme
MALHRLDHYNIETVVPEETVRFYTEVLGLTNAPERRPAVGQPGTWILVGDHPAIHVNFVDADRSGRTGSIDHVAFEGSGFEQMRAHLTEAGASYDVVESPQFDLKQIYVMDPNGIRIEINIRNE